MLELYCHERVLEYFVILWLMVVERQDKEKVVCLGLVLLQGVVGVSY